MIGHFRFQFVEFIASGSYLFLLVYGYFNKSPLLSKACLVLTIILSLIAYIATYRRNLSIADIATSKIASAAQGYVELYGRAGLNPENIIKSPLSGRDCVWFRYWVYSKDNSDREWRLSSSGQSDVTFEIKDNTGICLVDPDFAEITAPDKVESRQGEFKHVEEMLYAGGSIYVLGSFSTIGGSNSVLNIKEDVSALLAEWKKDPAMLKKRFDLDGNGEIDMQEWELARKSAHREIEKQHREIRAQPGVHVIRAPKDRRPFLISTLSPQALKKRYLYWSFFHLFVFVFTIYAFFWFKQ
jgi:hypothetical protein